jgi:hypothetical protein
VLEGLIFRKSLQRKRLWRHSGCPSIVSMRGVGGPDNIVLRRVSDKKPKFGVFRFDKLEDFG